MDGTLMTDPKTVVKEGPQTCGCYVTEYDDDTKEVQPCLACGLREAGECFQRGGQILQICGGLLGQRAAKLAAMNAMRKQQ